MNIYKITNLLNGKIYIGQEKNYNPNYYGSGILIKKEIEILGRENFRKEIIEYCHNIQDLNKAEIFWIKNYNSTNPDIGYNLAKGGSLFYMSSEIAKKISEALKGKYRGKDSSRYGSKLTEDHKRKISECNKGRRWSEESREKASKSRKGKEMSYETRKKISEAKINIPLKVDHRDKISKGITGRIHSDANKLKISIANMDKKQKHSKIVSAFNMNTGEAKKFNNISSAARFFNVSRGTIKHGAGRKIKEWIIKLE
jgi:group I intron endonuclease